MLTALAVVLGLLLVNFVLLYPRSVKENMALAEYSQFLLLNPELYTVQRGKFVEYLATTRDKTPMQRSSDAYRVIAHAARDGLDKILFANVASRNAAAAGK